MSSPYHEGEVRVQARAGVRQMAERIGRGIHPAVPPVARHFLMTQRMAVVGSADVDGRVWASLLAGRAGFLSAPAETLVRVGARPAAGDPLHENLRAGERVGLLVIDFARRMRMRVNGVVSRATGSGFEVETREVYSNCPKYIQARVPEAGGAAAGGARRDVRRASALTPGQQAFVARADTFFIASLHPERGADVSHRGGAPGFVSALGEGRLAWPDYSGNTMFNTLGNISVNPSTGLLFVDFESGDSLQVTGRARINWDEDFAARFAGAERAVEFEVMEVVETAAAVPFRWRFVEFSPFNPS